MAGPDEVRGSNLLPYQGTIEIDEADLNALRAGDGSQYLGIVGHEMGHVVSSMKVEVMKVMSLLLTNTILPLLGLVWTSSGSDRTFADRVSLVSLCGLELTLCSLFVWLF